MCGRKIEKERERKKPQNPLSLSSNSRGDNRIVTPSAPQVGTKFDGDRKFRRTSLTTRSAFTTLFLSLRGFLIVSFIPFSIPSPPSFFLLLVRSRSLFLSFLLYFCLLFRDKNPLVRCDRIVARKKTLSSASDLSPPPVPPSVPRSVFGPA